MSRPEDLPSDDATVANVPPPSRIPPESRGRGPSTRPFEPVNTGKRWRPWKKILAGVLLFYAVLGVVSIVASITAEDRAPSGVVGGAAVAKALHIDLSNDAEVRTACAQFLDDRVTFSEEVAKNSGVVNYDEKLFTTHRAKPTPADVIAWGEIACE